MNLTRQGAIRATNTELIKSLMSNKKQLENLEKEIYKKNRHRASRSSSISSSYRPFTPESFIRREINCRDLKGQIHRLEEENEGLDVLSKTGDALAWDFNKKNYGTERICRRKKNIITIPTAKIIETKSATCNNTPKEKKGFRFKEKDFRGKAYKVKRWKFTAILRI
ncbi:hypothetical protein SteCoe_15416 [Stentor coeruleus]|uniref:Uncharacterized protein n=1 Tax=Stentor coeruleus TaxID=5963 RepID=A0A1R2C3Q8_9CILI|nr:hypothetical protein SteCoe_15416 [Stentor coeruleus]